MVFEAFAFLFSKTIRQIIALIETKSLYVLAPRRNFVQIAFKRLCPFENRAFNVCYEINLSKFIKNMACCSTSIYHIFYACQPNNVQMMMRVERERKKKNKTTLTDTNK